MDTYDLKSLLNKAIQQLQYIKPGTEFLIRDLYSPIEWKSLPKNIRIQIGKSFLNYSENNTEIIEILPKSSANHQQYKIIG